MGELDGLEFRTYLMFVKGYQLRTRQAWEQTRMLYWMTYRMQTTEKMPKKPEQLMPLAWDKKPERGPKMEADDIKRVIQLYKS